MSRNPRDKAPRPRTPSTAVQTGRPSAPASAPGAVAPPANARDWFVRMVRERPLAMSVAAAIALTLLALVAFTPHYETNDDTTMNLIAAGVAFADRPDEHLVFTNVLIGLPLRQLYLAAPHVPWYGLYQFAALTAAAAALTYAFLRVNPSGWQAVAAGLFLAVGVLPYMAEVQFTRTASLASFAGLALLLAPLAGAANWPRAADVAGCGLLVLGSLIRFESFLLACVIFVPVAIAIVYASPGRALRRSLPVGVSLAAAVALYFVNLGYYAREEGWKDFYAYNAIRARFTDYKHFSYNAATRPAFDAAGWDELDYWMLMNWFYADRGRYSLARLQAITSQAPANPGPTLEFVGTQLVTRLPRFPAILWLMIAIPCIALMTAGRWRRLALPAVLFVFVFAIIMVMSLSGLWVPTRVASSLLIGALAGTALRPGVAIPPMRSAAGVEFGAVALRVFRGLAAGVAAVLVIWAYFSLSASDEDRLAKRQQALVAVKELNPRPDQLFVVWREYFPFDDVVFPLSDPAVLRPFHCVSMSWVLPTPFTDRRLREYDIADIYAAICDNPKVYVLAMPRLMLLFVEYVWRRDQRDLSFHHTYGNAQTSAFQVFQPGEGPGLVIRRQSMMRENAGGPPPAPR